MTAVLDRLRWWQIEDVLPLERELFGPDGWTARLFWSELAQSDTRHYLALVDGDRVIGYAGLCAYGEEAYIQTIGVATDRQGEGLGAALLLALLQEAERRAVRDVVLEVRAGNARAQDLYARFGFHPIGHRRGYYQPSNEDAVVMRRSLGSSGSSGSSGSLS